MERCFPDGDKERKRVTASWERGGSTSTPSARKMTINSLEIQKGFSTDFAAAQEATARSWTRS